MSDLTNLVESIKDGELSVVAQKLIAMQSTITSALSQISTLQLELQGNSRVAPLHADQSAVGVIHSPSRATNIMPSKEMFSGKYYVGDMLGNPSTGQFYFGSGSSCYFYFNPTDPNHGVNKKYVDQVVTPIYTQLPTLISRFGDVCPTPSSSIIPYNTFVFNSSMHNTVNFLTKWFINSTDANSDASGDFFSVLDSCFYLNVHDARYYGAIPASIYNLMTLGFCNSYYLKTNAQSGLNGTASHTANEGVTALFNDSSHVTFDSSSRLAWADTREVHTKTDNEIATIKNVTDLLPNIPSTLVSGVIGRFYGPFAGSLNFSFGGTTTQEIPNHGVFDLYFDPITSTTITCRKTCTISVTAAMNFHIAHINGATSDLTLVLKKSNVSYAQDRHQVNTEDQAQGYDWKLTLRVDTFMNLSPGQTISLSYIVDANQLTSETGNPSGSLDLCIIAG